MRKVERRNSSRLRMASTISFWICSLMVILKDLSRCFTILVFQSQSEADQKGGLCSEVGGAEGKHKVPRSYSHPTTRKPRVLGTPAASSAHSRQDRARMGPENACSFTDLRMTNFSSGQNRFPDYETLDLGEQNTIYSFGFRA